MGQVGIELDADLGAGVDRPAEPVPVGRAQPAPTITDDDVDAAVLGGELLGEARRPVGTVIVDDEHVDVGRHGP